MDKRLQKGNETREKIIEAALLIIAEEGIEKLSAKKVADYAKVSKSNVFHHFDSMDTLINQLFNSICLQTSSMVNADECKGAKDFLYQLGFMTFSLKGKELSIYKVLFTYYQEALYKDRYRNYVTDMKQDFVKYLQDNIKLLEGINITKELAELITIDLDGLGMHYLLEGDSEKYIGLWKLKCKMYVQYINSIGTTR